MKIQRSFSKSQNEWCNAKSWVLIIPFFLHPTPCYLILQWQSPCAKKTKGACLRGCTQQIVTKLKLLLKEGKREPMHVFCSHSKSYIYEQYPSLHLIQVVPPKRHLLYFSNPQSFSAHPPTSLVLYESYKCWAEWIHGTHAPESTPTSPGRRCSFNARISHGVKYPHQLLQLQTPPHKIHNLQLLQGGRGGRGRRVNYTK